MAGRTRAAREAAKLDPVRARFLAHLGDDPTERDLRLADRGARLVLRLAALDGTADRRRLTAQEAEDHARLTTELDLVTRRLGIAPAPRRHQPVADADTDAEDEGGGRLSATPWAAFVGGRG
jgi:hypothetical protein